MANLQISPGIYRIGSKWMSNELKNEMFIYYVNSETETNTGTNTEPARGCCLVDGTDYSTFRPAIQYSYWVIEEVDTTNHYYKMRPYVKAVAFTDLLYTLGPQNASNGVKVNCVNQNGASGGRAANWGYWYFSGSSITQVEIRNVQTTHYMGGNNTYPKFNGFSPSQRTASGTYTKFQLHAVNNASVAHQAFVKIGGSWKFCIPYIKINNKWKMTSNIYVKVGGHWKQV